MAALFWQFSSHKTAKRQNFQNRYTKFGGFLYKENLQTKFQVPTLPYKHISFPKALMGVAESQDGCGHRELIPKINKMPFYSLY